MKDFVHTWNYQGRTITFSWLGDVERQVSRAYALAFDQTSNMLLVGGTSDAGYWLPGGGIEMGETAEQALKRELMEEANATIEHMQRLGVQQSVDSQHGEDFQSFYWCRITVAQEFSPEHEVSKRILVSPEAFLDTLFWGRDDPKAELLLEQALKINQHNEVEVGDK